MTRTLPTEESLGLSPTDDELSTAAPQDDDVSVSDDDPSGTPDLAEPGASQTAAADKPAEKPAEAEKVEDPKMVDVRAVQEARAEAREAKQRAAVLEQRWNDYIALQAQPKPAEAPKEVIPGPDDPVARLNWTTEQLVALREQRERETTERAEAQRQQQAWSQTVAKVSGEYEAAVAADPSLTAAYDKLRESQGKEFLAMGLSVPEAKAELERLEQQHIAYVAQRGLNIGTYIKQLAEARGWQAAAPTPTQNGKTDLAAVAAAQQRHQSLSDAPGGETVAPLDAKALAKMTDKQFKDWMSRKGNEAKFDEIMGA